MTSAPSWLIAREARTERQRSEALSLIEEFESLKGTDKPAIIAQRMGYRPSTLARRFARNGRYDLAKGLWWDKCGTLNCPKDEHS